MTLKEEMELVGYTILNDILMCNKNRKENGEPLLDFYTDERAYIAATIETKVKRIAEKYAIQERAKLYEKSCKEMKRLLDDVLERFQNNLLTSISGEAGGMENPYCEYCGLPKRMNGAIRPICSCGIKAEKNNTDIFRAVGHTLEGLTVPENNGIEKFVGEVDTSGEK